MKRFRAATMGRASMIKHRTTHITLELDRIVRPAAKKEAPVDKKQEANGTKTRVRKQKKAVAAAKPAKKSK